MIHSGECYVVDLVFLEDFISGLTEIKRLTFKFVFWKMSPAEIAKVPARVRAILRRLPFPDNLNVLHLSFQCHDICDISDRNDFVSAFSAGFHSLVDGLSCLARIGLDVEGPKDILRVDWDTLRSTIVRSKPGTEHKLNVRRK